jgi:hypothetical protein
MQTMKSKLAIIAAPLLAALVGMAGCEQDLPRGLLLPGDADLPDGTVGNADPNADDDPTTNASDNEAVAGEDNTHSHPEGLGEDTADPFEVLEKRQEEGAPEIRTRLHSCQKLQNAALRNTLIAFGVDIDASANPDPAGELFRNGQDALGGANYASRSPESVVWTNSGATKFQDIMVMAAAEVIANLPNAEQCQVDGVGVTMFDDSDKCNEAAVTCIIGRPATDEHMAICNRIVEEADTVDEGKQLAVATLLAAAHTCE